MRLSMRDWRLPVLVAVGLVFARMSGGRLPYYLLYLSAGLLILSYLWTRYALRRTECIVQVERDRAELGESIGVRVRLDNDTFLPLPWVEVDDATPQHLVRTDLPRQATSVPLLGSRIMNFRLVPRRRGHYAVGPVRVALGDPFGLFQGAREFVSRAAITVYPRIHQIEGLPVPLSQPFGEVRTREKAFEDPSNQAEIRQYRPGDNPRHIHWKTSARMGELMLREYELTATTPIILFPDLSATHQVDMLDRGGGSTEETVVEVAASLAALGVRRKMEVGMVCHAQERFAVNPGRGQRSFHEIMEVLARVESHGRLTMEQVLELETAHLSSRSTLVVITPRLSSRLADMLVRLRANYQVMLVLLRRETFAPEGHAVDEVVGHGQGYMASLTSLLTARKIAVYLVSAQDDLRRLALLRLASPHEGVKSWSLHGHLSATRP